MSAAERSAIPEGADEVARGAAATEAADTSAGRPRPASRYRADIDGLRAVAVLPVLLFHAGFPVFGGGFVGVDVFFVISGYLITSVILDDIEAGRFSIVSFYERRIRRIFPALLATLLVTILGGTLVLLPESLKDLGQSAVAATLFASNVLFRQEAGYFDAPAEHKPLLHTWSLAVEEQFYIVFPILLLLLSRTGRRYAACTVPALLLSFALAAWSVRNAPSAAFYLAPARAWELLVGALLAMGAVPPPRRQGVRDGLSLLGLGLVAYSILAFSPATPFPGAAALLPCLGAGLVIHAGGGGRSLAGRLLSARPVVFVGLISYSLYLWHWPLLVLARSYAVRELTTVETLGILLLSILAAVASWRWVESPFRGKAGVLSRLPLFAAAGATMGVTAALGLGLHVADGLPRRLTPEATRFAEGARDRESRRACLDRSPDEVRDGRLCRMGVAGEARPSFLLWGDSHAEMFQPAMDEVAAQAGRTGLLAASPNCPPLLGVSVRSPESESSRECRPFNDAVLDLVRRSGAGTVVLAARWSMYATGARFRQPWRRRVYLSDGTGRANEAIFRQGLERTVATLAEAGKRVVIVAPVPEVAYVVPETLALAAWLGRDVDIRPARDEFDTRHRLVLSMLEELRQRSLATVVYPHAALCEGATCRVASGGRALYHDDNHLSRYGASWIRPIFDGVL